ncbi:glycosyltransferase family 4 protein [Acetobacteraceae bacterium]|nr:glycosyltransferase family 4 protein [Acetobacteraceae bacterium]
MVDSVSKKPVIAQILPSLEEGGGVARGALEIARALATAGAHSMIISQGRLSKEDEAKGILHIPFDGQKTFWPWNILKQFWKLQKILKEHEVDLLHVRSRHPAWLAFWACKKHQRLWITTWHGRHQAKYFSPRYFYNKVLLKGKCVIAVSQVIQERILKEYKYKKGRVFVIPRGADEHYFDAEHVSLAQKEALVSKWRLKANHTFILVPARLTRWKGQHLLLEALVVLNRFHSDWKCVFAGETTSKTYEKELLETIKLLGLEKQVLIDGFCSEMPVAYALADFVVLPNMIAEPFGRSAVEAQMSGCPVIASACGGFLESLAHSPTATLVPMGEIAPLVEAMKKEIEMPLSLRQERAKASRAYAKKNFSLFHMLKGNLEIYDRLLGTNLRDNFELAHQHAQNIKENKKR